MQERELISPAQSDQIIMIAALVVTLVGAVWGYRAVGPKGLMAALCGPLVFGMWQFHKYITRYDPGFDPTTGKYDPSREYFGLDKVKVLLFEVVLFVVLGAVLGWVWQAMSGTRINRGDAESVELKEG